MCCIEPCQVMFIVPSSLVGMCLIDSNEVELMMHLVELYRSTTTLGNGSVEDKEKRILTSTRSK